MKDSSRVLLSAVTAKIRSQWARHLRPHWSRHAPQECGRECWQRLRAEREAVRVQGFPEEFVTPLFWNLRLGNLLGCEDCFLGGTVDGQCMCKPNVGSRPVEGRETSLDAQAKPGRTESSTEIQTVREP